MERGAGGSGKLQLRDAQGHSISLHGSELAGAQARLSACPPALGAPQLGGITPYPGIPCVTGAQLSARTRDEAWRLELDSRQGGATSIVIRQLR